MLYENMTYEDKKFILLRISELLCKCPNANAVRIDEQFYKEPFVAFLIKQQKLHCLLSQDGGIAVTCIAPYASNKEELENHFKNILPVDIRPYLPSRKVCNVYSIEFNHAPTTEELEQLETLLHNADLDPLGSIVISKPNTCIKNIENIEIYKQPDAPKFVNVPQYPKSELTPEEKAVNKAMRFF